MLAGFKPESLKGSRVTFSDMYLRSFYRKYTVDSLRSAPLFCCTEMPDGRIFNGIVSSEGCVYKEDIFYFDIFDPKQIKMACLF